MPNQARLLHREREGHRLGGEWSWFSPISALTKCVLGQVLYFPVPISLLSKGSGWTGHDFKEELEGMRIFLLPRLCLKL